MTEEETERQKRKGGVKKMKTEKKGLQNKQTNNTKPGQMPLSFAMLSSLFRDKWEK